MASPSRWRICLSILGAVAIAALGIFGLARLLVDDSRRPPVQGIITPPSEVSQEADSQTKTLAQQEAETARVADLTPSEAPVSRLRLSLDPAITLIEDRFLISGKRFSELPILEMSLDEVDDVAQAIQLMQQKEQEVFFAKWDLDDLLITSGEDYIRQRLFLFTDLMALPIKRDGRVTGDWFLADKNDCPTIYGMREMLRVIWKNEEYAQRNKRLFDDHINKTLSDHPFAHLEGPEDMSKYWILGPDGAFLGGGGVPTVGND